MQHSSDLSSDKNWIAKLRSNEKLVLFLYLRRNCQNFISRVLAIVEIGVIWRKYFLYVLARLKSRKRWIRIKVLGEM